MGVGESLEELGGLRLGPGEDTYNPRTTVMGGPPGHLLSDQGSGRPE